MGDRTSSCDNKNRGILDEINETEDQVQI